ncbi:MAG: AMP-binding protein, partial [Pseudonocardiaceae bacterium]|nr:AMP-binding protein [Pseudonocardiaceae bacterium]
ERARATTLWPLFPAFTRGLIDHPLFSATDLGRVKQLPTVGPPEMLLAAQRAFPHARVMNAYGMTETSAIIVLPEHGESLEHRVEWSGTPFRGIEARIIDPETGGPAHPGEIGELLVRGYCILDGYYREPQKTADTIDDEGWLHTGDLCLMDEEGRVAFRGRLKDMLKVGGENVAALEIEAFISSHSAVRHVEVVGVPDPRLDEVPVAFVEVYDGDGITEDALIEFCEGSLASYKVPRHIRFVEPYEWPMSATKVDKTALRERIQEELGAGRAPRRSAVQTLDDHRLAL